MSIHNVMGIHWLQRVLISAVCASLLACGGGADTPVAQNTPTDKNGQDHYVDDGGVDMLSEQEKASAEIQDVLADRLQAAREAARFTAKVDLSQYTVSYDGLPVLTRSNYFEMNASADAFPLASAQLSDQVQNFLPYGNTFGFTDIKLIKTASGQIQLINNTPRTFRQMLWRKSTGAMLALDFGANTILPFSTSTVVAAGLSGTELFYETASLFRSVGYKFDTNLNEVNGCDGITTQCTRKGTAIEQRRLENTLARMKLAHNTYGMSKWGSQFSQSSSGCLGSYYNPACISMAGDTELYMWTQIGKMALHPRGVSALGYLVNYGGTIGLAVVGGNAGWMRFTSNASGSLDTVHHESAHNYGYGHESGMSYGMSNAYIAKNLQNITNFHVETLPQHAIVATPTNEANTWVISVLAQQAQIPKSLRFMLVAREQGFAASLGQIQGNSNQFVLKLTQKPANPIAIKVYPDAANVKDSDILGSVVLQPL